ncbi:trehalose-phosphatase [Afifella pfennigii]|uniref:trehalose-phosphatase n=1 Tax=Afifella pfennigii TaxID=209897 RepID=UPI00047D345D|nr:trehalose-phosphatase [Afifella pfennigii]
MGELGEPPLLDHERHALFLDFDGTLVGFADDPEGIELEPGTLQRLKALQTSQGGALALISGRALASIDRFLAPFTFPAAGVHGQELRFHPGESVEAAPPPAAIEVARERLGLEIGAHDPLRLEDKGAALVIHYRTAPHEEERALELAEAAIAGLDGLRLVKGHAIAEIRPQNVHKGKAIERLMARSPFAERAPVFVGDDTTDEDGFRFVASRGGFGVKVGEGETAASYRLADVPAVHRWLQEAAR